MTEKEIYMKLMSTINNKFGVCGLMGNMYAESGLKANNAQNSGNKRTGLTDEQYTAAVDKGTYKRFCSDSIGYGFCQWTTSGRKTALYNFCKNRGASIGNDTAQLDYLIHELQTSYKPIWNALKSATSVRTASDVVLTRFEMPRDQGESVKKYRASQGQRIYNACCSMTISNPQNAPVASQGGHTQINYKVGQTYTICIPSLRVRTKKSSQDINAIPKGTQIGSKKNGEHVVCRATAAVGSAIWMYIGNDKSGKEQWICADTGTECYVK